MDREEMWRNAILKIANFIEEQEPSCIDEQIMLFNIEYSLLQMGRSEEKFNDCLRTLDLYGRKEDVKCLRKEQK